MRKNNKNKSSKMFLVKFTVNGTPDRVRISHNSQEEVEQQFKKWFSPDCAITEIIDISNWD